VPKSLAALVLVCWFPAGFGAAELPRVRAPWLKMATANFELYTTADEDAGRSVVYRLERLRTILQPILAWRGEPRGEPRDEREKAVCIIAFGSRDEFQAYAPIGRSIGYFLPGARRDFVVLDGSRAESRAVEHEYVHFVMAQSGLRLPPWLNEGLAELYSNLQESRSGERTEIGRLIPGRVASLRQDAWIGLDRLISADPDSPIFNSAEMVDSAYAESWLLTHMLVLDPRYQDRFSSLLSALQTLDTAEAFRQVYGKPVAEEERDLKRYLEAAQTNIRILGDPPRLELHIRVERDADFDGLSAVAEMLGNYRGRGEQSQELYRRIARDYPARVP